MNKEKLKAQYKRKETGMTMRLGLGQQWYLIPCKESINFDKWIEEVISNKDKQNNKFKKYEISCPAAVIIKEYRVI